MLTFNNISICLDDVADQNWKSANEYSHAIRAGIGNQLFRYAGIKTIALQKKLDFAISPQNELSALFDLKIKLHNVPSNIHYPSGWTYSQDYITKCKDGCDLYGYFQDTRYIDPIEQKLRDDLIIKSEILSFCNLIREQWKSELICLHIRRGDYVNNPFQLALCPLDYYKKALDLMPPELSVLVFSDDPQWCIEQPFFQQERFTFVHTNRNLTTGIYVPDSNYSLALMSLCNRFIIANSTYSWWGAWLANSKQVVAPNKWWNIDNMNKNMYQHMIPHSWQKISW